VLLPCGERLLQPTEGDLTMRLSLRFVLPLILVLAAFAYAIVPLVDQLTQRWFVRDMDIRSALIANTIGEPLLEQLAAGSKEKTANFFVRITQDERLYAIGYCATPESPPLASKPAGIGARHEFHPAPQRGDQALRLLFLRRPQP
jgi:hypothetical protein